MHFSCISKTTIGIALSSIIAFSPTLAEAQPTAAAPAASSTEKSMEKSSTITVNDDVMLVAGRLSLGVLNGEVNEIVYNPVTGRKVSHLDWQIDNTVMVGAGLSVTPSSWIKLNVDLAFSVSDGSGSMDDYDWVVPGLDWTDWSSHDDMTVDQIWKLDLNAEFPLYEQPSMKITGILGFKREEYEFSASGGNFIYSVNGFRDTIGSFQDGLLAISYEQVYTTPYIGIGFSADMQPLTFSGRVIGSALVNLEATDTHHLRNLEFEDDFETGTMFGIDLALAYSYSHNLQFMFGFQYLNYDEVKGSTQLKDLSTGEVSLVGGDAAGSDNSSGLIMLALVYNM